MKDRMRIMTAAACLAAAGCYSYVPVPLGDIPQGAQARARLSAEEAVRMRELLGREDRLLEGEVVESGGDALLLAIPVGRTTAGLPSRQLHQRVRLSRSAIVEIEQRTLSTWRTGLLIGGGAAVAAAIVTAAFAAADEPDGQGKPQPERILIPLFRFD